MQGVNRHTCRFRRGASDQVRARRARAYTGIGTGGLREFRDRRVRQALGCRMSAANEVPSDVFPSLSSGRSSHAPPTPLGGVRVRMWTVAAWGTRGRRLWVMSVVRRWTVCFVGGLRRSCRVGDPAVVVVGGASRLGEGPDCSGVLSAPGGGGQLPDGDYWPPSLIPDVLIGKRAGSSTVMRKRVYLEQGVL
jgi:hypothetical protein